MATALDPKPKHFDNGVRFVGGPWHNRIVPVRADVEIRVPIASCDPGSPDPSYSFELYVYRLKKVSTSAGAVFWEYVLQPRSTGDTLSIARHSD